VEAGFARVRREAANARWNNGLIVKRKLSIAPDDLTAHDGSVDDDTADFRALQ